jgi:hypothetical protein
MPATTPANLRLYASFAVLEYTEPPRPQRVKAISHQLRTMSLEESRLRL